MGMTYININRNLRGTPATFNPNVVPDNEAERLDALRRFKIFATPSEEIFSAYTELAALSFRTPIGLMSFVGENSVHYKQAYGVERTGQVTPRKNSPCSIAILSRDITMFRYALTDPCVLADEKNLAEAGYKFYVGAPLITHDGYNIGMLAVVDRVPRNYTDQELRYLQQLASETMIEVQVRLNSSDSASLLSLNKRLKALHARVDLLRREHRL
jgi:GAF domain-containing protein